MTIKLKLCPFCGNRADPPFYWEVGDQTYYELSCSECPGSAGAYFATAEAAIEAWNCRPIDRELVERAVNLARLHMLKNTKSRSKALELTEILVELEKENAS